MFSRAQELVEFVGPDDIEFPAFMAVRDPVDRFASLWRNKCRDGDPNMPVLKGMSPRKLLRTIRKNPSGNTHWIPQAVLYRPGVEVVDYRQLGDRLGLDEIRVNETKRRRGPAMPADAIRRHYAADARLWEKV